MLILALGGVMLTLVGRDFFPAIDGGQIKLHVRAPAATRIEATERIFQEVEDKIREVIPERERDLIVDDIGVPQRVYNLAFTDGSTIGPNDGVILVALKEGHAPTAGYVRKLREVLPAAFPSVTFYFQAADMVTQILNFGLPAQIDVRAVGRDRATNLRVAHELRRRIAAIPGLPTPICSRRSMRRHSWPRSIGRVRCSSGSTRKHRQRRQYQPELLRAGHAQFLDRSGSRDSLLHHGADAAASGELARRDRQHAGFHQNRRRRSADTGPAEQRRDAQARQRPDQFEPDQHSAGL